MLDNAGDPTESRAERYEVNEAACTARLVRSFGADPAAFTPIGGSVQALPGGRTLVSFGRAGRVEEYDADGRIVWRIEGGAATSSAPSGSPRCTHQVPHGALMAGSRVAQHPLAGP